MAWVQGEGRVVLTDLTHLETAEPLVCPEPAAALWRALAQSPQTLDELTSVAVDAVGPHDASLLLEAFLETFEARGLVVTTE